MNMSTPEPRPHANSDRAAKFIFKASLLAAVLATVVSALLIAVLSAASSFPRGTASPTVLEVASNALLLIPITVVSCGFYGLVAGLAGSSLLGLRRRRIRSTRRLLIEAGIIGLLFGFLFPFFDHLVSQSYINGMQALFSAPVGALCALLCAAALRRRFLKSSDATA